MSFETFVSITIWIIVILLFNHIRKDWAWTWPWKKEVNRFSQYPLYDTMYERYREPKQALDEIKVWVCFDCEDYVEEHPGVPFCDELRDMACMLRGADQGELRFTGELRTKYGNPERFWEIAEEKMQDWQNYHHPDDVKLYCIRAELTLLLKPNSSIAEGCVLAVLKEVKEDSPDYGYCAHVWTRIAWAINLPEYLNRLDRILSK